MRLRLYLASIFFLFNAYAQVEVIPETTEPTDEVKAESAIVQLGEYLVERDEKCSTKNRLIKSPDLMQTYLKLTLFKQENSSVDRCDEAKRYLACLRSAKSSFLAEHLINNKSAAPLLMKKYDVSEDQIESLLDYYKNLGKPVAK